MFLVTLTNFGTTRDFNTFDEAVAWTKRTCFEASISLHGMIVATFSPISGLRNCAGWHA